MNWINLFFLAVTTPFFLLMVFSHWKEREFRALGITVLGLCLNSVMWVLFLVYGGIPWVGVMNIGVVAVLLLLAVLSGLRFFPPRKSNRPEEITPYDERDHMFSRNNLKFHPPLFREYYNRNPEKKAIDQRIHRQPELGDPAQQYFDPHHSPVFRAAFSFLDKTRPVSRGPANDVKGVADPKDISRVLRQMAVFYGAVDVGVTSLNSHHLYSRAGRHSNNWGREIKNNHITAIVIVVAMDTGMMKQAPALPAILESSRQYVEAAKIANILAEYLRMMGADARAHTDGNYQTLCVPLAVDSGLGELGRMGILIHRKLGPCVRLSVVTTDLKLVTTGKTRLHIEEFCRFCKKCARHCPARAISSGKEGTSRGAVHWSIQQERCFSYWKKTGTDCGFCIRVCPYTKPDTLFHRLVRFYISRNPLNQRMALFFDDLLYGKNIPVPQSNPGSLFTTFN